MQLHEQLSSVCARVQDTFRDAWVYCPSCCKRPPTLQVLAAQSTAQLVTLLAPKMAQLVAPTAAALLGEWLEIWCLLAC